MTGDCSALARLCATPAVAAPRVSPRPVRRPVRAGAGPARRIVGLSHARRRRRFPPAAAARACRGAGRTWRRSWPPRPSVVVRYWGGDPRLVAALERRGVRVVTIEDAPDFAGVRANVRTVAAALGRRERGRGADRRHGRPARPLGRRLEGRARPLPDPGRLHRRPRHPGRRHAARRRHRQSRDPRRLPDGLRWSGWRSVRRRRWCWASSTASSLAGDSWGLGRHALLQQVAARSAPSPACRARMLGCPDWCAAEAARAARGARAEMTAVRLNLALRWACSPLLARRPAAGRDPLERRPSSSRRFADPASAPGEMLWRHPRARAASPPPWSGAALGLAGAVMQGLLRNPLADPGVLGVSGGAGLGAALAIAVGPGAACRAPSRARRWPAALAAGAAAHRARRAVPRAGDPDPVRRGALGLRRRADLAGVQLLALAGDHGRGVGLAAGLGGQPRLGRHRLRAAVPMRVGAGPLRLRRARPGRC